MAVTDHDTVAACADVWRLAGGRGIGAIPGIEITAVENGRDVHMLGYGFDIGDAALAAFLMEQRGIRASRLDAIAARLADLAMPVDLASLVAEARAAHRTVGRPLVADAMIAAGYVADRREAFDRWLGADRPAFVARQGAAPERVIAIVHAAGGIVSLAHPGRTNLPDERIAALAAAGLDAIEVYHSDHDETAVIRYGELADRLRVLRSGGSDFHGDPSHGVTIGHVTLPAEHWARLEAAMSSH